MLQNKDFSLISYYTSYFSSISRDSLISCSLISPRSTESVLSNFFFSSEDGNLNTPSKISFPDTVPFSVDEPAHWTSIRLTLHTQPNKRSASSHSTERPPRLHTTSQRKKIPNYHSHLGLISADEPPNHHYDNPPQLFQSRQKTLTMEGHQTYHYLFYQILSRRRRRNMNQEIHLHHIPHLLSQYFRLYWTFILWGNITNHWTTNMICLDFWKCIKFTSPYWWSKLKNRDLFVLE